MTLEIGLVYGILALALVLFASNRAPVDLVAIGVLLALVLLRVVDATAALRGFSNAAVVTMGAVFVIGAGTTRTGVAHWLGLWMQRAAGRSEARLVALTMVAGGVLSGFMAAIGAAAVMLPAVVAAARGMRAPVSRVLLPLTYAAIIGNMLTLIATPGNLLVDDALNRRGLPPFGLFEFTPIGATVLAVSVAFVVATRRWLLPERAAGAQVDALLPAQRNQHEPYQLQDRLYKVAVPPGSQLAHTTIRESGIGKRFGIIVLAIDRHGHRLVAPGPTAAILPQDELLISARIEDMDRFVAGLGLSALGRPPLELAALHTEQISVVEVVLAPRTELAGRTLASINFRDRYGLNVLGIWRGGAAPRRTHLTDVVLQGGDAMLLQGPMARIANLRTDRNFVVVTAEVGLRFRSSRAPVAVVILLGFVGVVLAGVLPVAIGALAGAAAMVATGCVTMHEARASVDWRAILLVAAMLAMAEAMRTTGAAALIANGMVAGIGGGGPWPVLAGIVLLSCLFAHAMSNHVTAVLMAPIAIDAAVHAGADPRMFAMGVALGATMPFMSPYAHPANLLVMGPGNYLFGDYVRAGLPLVAVTLAASLVMLYFVYGR